MFRSRVDRGKFALLNYTHTNNLGDEIQSLAARRFLPHVDALVDRECLDEFRADTPHAVILSGWFMYRPDHWPPSASLRPLIISFHLTKEINPEANLHRVSPETVILGDEGVQFLKQHEPIGARDLDTMARLQAAGVASYFSGCLSLTLRPTQPIGEKRDAVYAVDVSDEVFSAISRRYDLPIFRLTHGDRFTRGSARFEKAEALLRYYAGAHAVVTSRLHCALPCLALGTPVLFVQSASDLYRFDGLRELVWTASERDVVQDRYDFDFRSPPENPKSWQGLRDELELRCQTFVRASQVDAARGL